MNSPVNHSAEANQLRWGMVIAICGGGCVVIFLVLSLMKSWREEEPPLPPEKTPIADAKIQSHRPKANSETVNEIAIKPAPVPRTKTTAVRPPNEVAATEVPSPTPQVNPASERILPATGGAILASGSVHGFVFLKDAPPPEKTIEMDATCGRLHPQPVTTRHFVVGTNGGLANVFVYVKAGLPQNKFLPLAPAPLLDQTKCTYEPYVFGVMATQPFTIRNSDPFLHNVHATPKINNEFNLGQPTQGQVNEKRFEKPEIFARIKCDVHNWMFAYACVSDHPFFAVTDTNGFFELPKELPAGRYTLAAAHQKLLELTQPVTIMNGEPGEIYFEFNSGPKR